MLFSARASAKRPPASVEKLYTATTALERFGPTAQLSTTVLGTGQLGPNGVWEGDLYLHGGGDPTFGDSSFIHSHYGGVGRASRHSYRSSSTPTASTRFAGPSTATSPSSTRCTASPRAITGRTRSSKARSSALAFDRGETGKERGPHAPAAYAARKLWAR